MVAKRKDKRGRVLRNGEIQLADGRYRYKYIGLDGEEHCEYSWRLDVHDPHPAGKHKDLSLREKETIVERDMLAGIVPKGGNLTVYDLAKLYISLKANVRYNTKIGYNTVLNILKNDNFGKLRIDQINNLAAKKWFHDMQQNGRGSSSIKTIRGVLRPAFKHAVENDLIRKNPFDFPVFEVLVNDTVHRDALTPKQTRYFLNFIKNDKHYCRYYYPILVLFRTGLRISEFCGLTLSNIDMKNKHIIVDHQLQKERNGNYFIEAPKSEAGKRVVPMTDEVYEAFKVILAERKQPKTERIINGYSGFIFYDKNENPTVAMHWINRFRLIVAKHDNIYAKKLPPITPHVARHTFITDMARKRMDPRHLQSIAGHSDISITYQVYTHLNTEDVQNEVSRIENENSGKAD